MSRTNEKEPVAISPKFVLKSSICCTSSHRQRRYNRAPCTNYILETSAKTLKGQQYHQQNLFPFRLCQTKKRASGFVKMVLPFQRHSTHSKATVRTQKSITSISAQNSHSCEVNTNFGSPPTEGTLAPFLTTCFLGGV
jgi:hypothetical protein